MAPPLMIFESSWLLLAPPLPWAPIRPLFKAIQGIQGPSQSPFQRSLGDQEDQGGGGTRTSAWGSHLVPPGLPGSSWFLLPPPVLLAPLWFLLPPPVLLPLLSSSCPPGSSLAPLFPPWLPLVSSWHPWLLLVPLWLPLVPPNSSCVPGSSWPPWLLPQAPSSASALAIV